MLESSDSFNPVSRGRFPQRRTKVSQEIEGLVRTRFVASAAGWRDIGIAGKPARRSGQA